MQPSDLMEAPNIRSPDQARDKNWRTEYEAFLGSLPELLKLHRNKFVAVRGGAVIAVADAFKDAAMQACQRAGYVPLHVGLAWTPLRNRLAFPPRGSSLRHPHDAVCLQSSSQSACALQAWGD
jgi:hypothetical protein